MVQEINQQSEELIGFVEDLLDTNQNYEGNFIYVDRETIN